MSLSEAVNHETEAEELRVSVVARSYRGFMRAYEKAKGNSRKMISMRVPGIKRVSFWAQRRQEFIARHLKQYQKKGGRTRRRWLALVMWAFKPPGRPPPRRRL